MKILYYLMFWLVASIVIIFITFDMGLWLENKIDNLFVEVFLKILLLTSMTSILLGLAYLIVREVR